MVPSLRTVSREMRYDKGKIKHGSQRKCMLNCQIVFFRSLRWSEINVNQKLPEISSQKLDVER